MLGILCLCMFLGRSLRERGAHCYRWLQAGSGVQNTVGRVAPVWCIPGVRLVPVPCQWHRRHLAYIMRGGEFMALDSSFPVTQTPTCLHHVWRWVHGLGHFFPMAPTPPFLHHVWRWVHGIGHFFPIAALRSTALQCNRCIIIYRRVPQKRFIFVLL